MKTLKENIQKIEADYKKKIEAAKRENQILEQIKPIIEKYGEVDILNSNGGIYFMIYNNSYSGTKKDDKKILGSVRFGDKFNNRLFTLKQAREVLKLLPSSKSNQVLTFAAKEDKETYSPFRLTFHNSFISGGYATISYLSSKNIHVSINVSLHQYSNDIKTGYKREAIGYEAQEMRGRDIKRIGGKYLVYSYKLSMFDTTHYYGGDWVNTCGVNDDPKEYKHVIFNGHVKEFSNQWAKELQS